MESWNPSQVFSRVHTANRHCLEEAKSLSACLHPDACSVELGMGAASLGDPSVPHSPSYFSRPTIEIHTVADRPAQRDSAAP